MSFLLCHQAWINRTFCSIKKASAASSRIGAPATSMSILVKRGSLSGRPSNNSQKELHHSSMTQRVTNSQQGTGGLPGQAGPAICWPLSCISTCGQHQLTARSPGIKSDKHWLLDVSVLRERPPFERFNRQPPNVFHLSRQHKLIHSGYLLSPVA